MQNTETVIFIHEIKLPKNGKSKESDAFADRFNNVSEQWEKANNTSISEEERKKHMDIFFHMKYCLEQGI